MTQQQKDLALQALQDCTIHGDTISLPIGELDTEIFSFVKDALHAAGAKYNQKTRAFKANGEAQAKLDAAVEWLQSQDVVTYDAPALYQCPIEVDAEEISEEPQQDKKIHSQKERRTLRYDFTASEIHDLAMQLAHKSKEVANLEEEKSSVVAQYGSKIKEAKATQGRLANLVAEGYEYRETEVEIFYHQPQVGKKTLVRQDTGKAVVEKMEHWEYNLFTQPVDEDHYAEEAL